MSTRRRTAALAGLVLLLAALLLVWQWLALSVIERPPAVPSTTIPDGGPLPGFAWLAKEDPAVAARVRSFVSVVIARQKAALADPGAFGRVTYYCTAPGCGGLADRLFGMIVALYLGAVTERAVFIDHSSPVPLERFWSPRHVDWRPLRPATLLGRLAALLGYERQYYCLDTCDEPGLMRDALQSNARALSLKTNLNLIPSLLAQDDERIKALGLRELHAAGLLPRIAWSLLFTPSPELEAAVRPYAAALAGAPVLGVHVRTGGDQDEWSDPLRYSAGDLPLFLAFADALQAAALPGGLGAEVRRLVVTDSRRLADRVATERFADVTVNNSIPITHLDRSVDVPPLHHLRTFLEFELLLRADALVITRSGFSELASAFTCAPTVHVGVNSLRLHASELLVFPRGACFPWRSLSAEGYQKYGVPICSLKQVLSFCDSQ